jgi:hypothetical protein
MSTKTDNAMLAKIVEECFLLAMDNRLTLQQRAQFGELAEHLRAKLMILFSKTFDEGTPELLEANKQLKKVNAMLKKAAEDLAKIADTVEQLSKLVSTIDSLLKIPLVFV